jgi:hypothetical protein
MTSTELTTFPRSRLSRPLSASVSAVPGLRCRTFVAARKEDSLPDGWRGQILFKA